MSNLKISLIVAAAENNAIGKNNEMLWYLPNDFKYFKKTTSEHSIVMGRKTFDSIGKALPNRRNIVITRNQHFQADEVDVVNSLDEVLLYCRDEREVFIIGGAEIYKQALNMAHKIYFTRVHTTLAADAFFPDLSPEEWKLVSQEHHEPDEKHAYAYSFEIYERMV